MKIHILFALLLLISSATATTYEFPNNNITGLMYESNQNDIDYDTGLQYDTYKLNSSDSLENLLLEYTIHSFPTTIRFALQNSKNDTFNVNVHQSLIGEYCLPVLGCTITTQVQKYDATLNGVKVISDQYVNITRTALTFDQDEVQIKEGLIKIVTKFTHQGEVITSKNYYFNTIYIDTNPLYTFNRITVRYTDNGIASIKYDIDEQYNDLNFIFKFIFLILNALLELIRGVSIVLTGISVIAGGGIVGLTEMDILQYQSSLLEPLSVLSWIIDMFFSLIGFIYTNGILWFITITMLIIFIIAYIKSDNDLLKTFTIFIEMAQPFYKTVLIKPLIWLYENVLLKVIALLRG